MRFGLGSHKASLVMGFVGMSNEPGALCSSMPSSSDGIFVPCNVLRKPIGSHQTSHRKFGETAREFALIIASHGIPWICPWDPTRMIGSSHGIPRDTLNQDIVQRDPVKRGTVKRDTVKRDTVKEDTVN